MQKLKCNYFFSLAEAPILQCSWPIIRKGILDKSLYKTINNLGNNAFNVLYCRRMFDIMCVLSRMPMFGEMWIKIYSTLMLKKYLKKSSHPKCIKHACSWNKMHFRKIWKSLFLRYMLECTCFSCTPPPQNTTLLFFIHFKGFKVASFFKLILITTKIYQWTFWNKDKICPDLAMDFLAL